MTRGGPPTVLFHAAAGRRLGYGHLVRCGALAAAMRVRGLVSLGRARPEAVRAAAQLGLRVCTGRSLLRRIAPLLVVVDHPNRRAAARWMRRARAHGIPVASIHDRGIGRVESDLVIDGALEARSGRRRDLVGVRFAILRDDIQSIRRASPARHRRTVVVALGGGGHVRRHAAGLARAIRARVPSSRVVVAPGFSVATPPALPPGCTWLPASGRLAHALATAAAAIVAGGVTLYEAAALGTPVVAVSVVSAQSPTVRRFARTGALLAAGDVRSADARRRAAESVARLLDDPVFARRLGARAQRLVDAGGTARVARELIRLTAGTRVREGRRAA